MKVEIINRKKLLEMIKDDWFNEEYHAVISFYRKNEKPFVLSDCKATVLRVNVDDDINIFASFFLDHSDQDEAVAKFIMDSLLKNKTIYCQCLDGKTYSAACAAAIYEYFLGIGLMVFADKDYHPDRLMFNKIYYALREARVFMSTEQINSILPLNRQIDERALISQIMQKIRQIHNEHRYFDVREYFIITSDGIWHCFQCNYKDALRRFLDKYTDDQVVYARLGLCDINDLLGFDCQDFWGAVSYDIDSESGLKYNYNHYQAYLWIINDLLRKYNVTGRDVYD